MELLIKIKEQLSSFEKQKQALVDELKKEFGPILKPLFEKHPDVESISWAQYTPYFNDGDECTFRTQTDSIDINDTDKYDLDEKFEPAFEEFTDLLSSIPQDFYKDLFGDHVRVTVNNDGSVETEEYEHD